MTAPTLAAVLALRNARLRAWRTYAAPSLAPTTRWYVASGFDRTVGAYLCRFSCLRCVWSELAVADEPERLWEAELFALRYACTHLAILREPTSTPELDALTQLELLAGEGHTP